MKSKKVTKKQLLAAACAGHQKELINKYWPFGKREMSLEWVIYRAADLNVPFHTIGVLIQILDPENWVTVVRGAYHRIDYKASVERYLGEEVPAGRPAFVPQYWWEGSFAQRLIEKGINPTYPFAPPWYPRHVSEREYREMHRKQFPSSVAYRQAYENDWSLVGKEEDVIGEKTVTKVFTKKQLLDAICDDRYKKVIEMYWPPGAAELAIRQIVTIARSIQDVPLYAVDDKIIGQLIHRLDHEGWGGAIGGLRNVHLTYTGRVNNYLKRDEERILRDIQPTIEEAMRRPTMVPAPGSDIPEQYGMALDAEIRGGTMGVDFGQTWTPRSLTYEKLMKAMAELEETRKEVLREQIRREGEQSAPADMTLKETVALIKKLQTESDAPSKAIYLKLFSGGDGLLRDVGSGVYFSFGSIEGLERGLKELTAPADYHSLFKVVSGCLKADFSEIEITEENCLPLSLAKWQVNRVETAKAGKPIIDGANSTCACCKLYYSTDIDCRGCPISRATGRSLCDGTPYEDYHKASQQGDLGGALTANIKEERFLEDLIARRS